MNFIPFLICFKTGMFSLETIWMHGFLVLLTHHLALPPCWSSVVFSFSCIMRQVIVFIYFLSVRFLYLKRQIKAEHVVMPTACCSLERGKINIYQKRSKMQEKNYQNSSKRCHGKLTSLRCSHCSVAEIKKHNHYQPALYDKWKL